MPRKSKKNSVIHDDFLPYVRAKLAELKLSQKDLAASTHISPTTLCNWLQDKQGINSRKLTLVYRRLDEVEAEARKSAAGGEDQKKASQG